MSVYEEMKGELIVSMEAIAYHWTLIRLMNIVSIFFRYILMVINILQVARKNVEFDYSLRLKICMLPTLHLFYEIYDLWQQEFFLRIFAFDAVCKMYSSIYNYKVLA